MKPPSPTAAQDVRLAEETSIIKETVENGVKESTKYGAPVHIEILVHHHCLTAPSTLRDQWKAFLHSTDLSTLIQDKNNNNELNLSLIPEALSSCVRATVVTNDECNAPQNTDILSHANEIFIHIYKLSEEEVVVEELEPTGGDAEWTAACDNTTLPHASLDGTWESLIMGEGIKQSLLQYALSALLFSEKQVSSHVVSWNRLLLLHGPSGTGKTTLCRSLAHKLAIRLSDRFPSGATLLEIHSHSLFSKWFSTSGKLISRLFELVREMVQDDRKSLVVVLVDEVESLAGSRSSLSASEGEPSDALRAVNALLTSLDRLRQFPNVLVLATSNLTSSIDFAFMDRVDLKLYVGLPILQARYEIFRSCLIELVRVGIIAQGDKDGKEPLLHFQDLYKTVDDEEQERSLSMALLKCAEAADGLSGRSLRRLPLQSHALYVQSSGPVSMERFIEALRQGISTELSSREQLATSNSDSV